MLRLRSDEQLVALFRSGNNEAFRVIHDRYRQRLFAYTRQMLPGSRQDAEDALQDVFVRAYGGLRANDRELAVRAWLYRIAHNRCIDELRRPAPPPAEVMELVRPPASDPIHEAEQRESLRRLIEDVRRLPDQQRSALLMRELGGMSYVEVAAALGVSVAAIKSLLVRARVSLAQAAEARETSCCEIREDLILSHDRGVRSSGLARRHMRECKTCRAFRGELKGTSKQLAALLPAIGPAGAIAKLLGFGGGAGGGAAAGGSAAAGGGAAAGTGTAAAGGILGTGASIGVLSGGAGHIATLLATAVVAAGGAVEIQHSIAPSHHARHHAAAGAHRSAAAGAPAAAPASAIAAGTPVTTPTAPAVASQSASAPFAPAPAQPSHPRHHPALDQGAPLPPQPLPDLTAPYGPDPATGTATTSTAPASTATTGTTTTGAPGTTPATGTTTPTTPTSTPGGTGTTGTTTPGSTGTSTGTGGGSSTGTGSTSGSPSGSTSGTGTTTATSSGSTTPPPSGGTAAVGAFGSGGAVPSAMS